jgi:hypothetical protein
VLGGDDTVLGGDDTVLVGHRPVLVGDDTVLVGDDTVLGGDDTVLGGDGPVLEGDVTVLGEDDTVLGEDRPVLEGDVTVLGGDRPVLEGDVTVLGGDRPVLGGDVTVLGGDVTVLGGDGAFALQHRGDLLPQSMPDGSSSGITRRARARGPRPAPVRTARPPSAVPLARANLVIMATPPDPSPPSIRVATAAAVEASPEFVENRLLKFLQTMSVEEEQLLEHLAELDRREHEAEMDPRQLR